jgi:hypothetical protein
MTPYPPAIPPFYPPQFYSQMSPWGFSNHGHGVLPSMPSPRDLPAYRAGHRGTAQSQQPNHSHGIEEWCNKYNLGVEECKGLIKLGFRLDKPEELDDLNEETWASVGLGHLHQRRIKAACAAAAARN